MAESPGSDYDFQPRGRRYLMPLMRPNSSSLLASLLEYSGLLRDQRHHYFGVEPRSPLSSNPDNTDRDETAVSIWIIRGEGREGGRENNERYASEVEEYSPLTPTAADSNNIVSSSSVSVNDNGDGDNDDDREEPEVVGTGRRARVGTASLRYNALQLAQWIEQGLPFTILLLIVFIRQHLQGFIVVLWVSAVMYKANNLIRKQTPIKSERKTIVLLAIVSVLIAHVTGVYWWYRKQNLFRSLFILPPKDIPKFWEALFIIIVNDTMVRQIAMVVKSGILICYKNSKGRAYRRQAQLLTLIEYTLILYRALLPVPVWYRFFLNKLYGNLLSSLSTGLYLTFKLMATLEKVQSFFSAVVAFSQMEVQYGSCATSEEVLAAGDWCAICQEKMHAPISLRCKHIFCEDCVSEWFERERTCPLCRAVVESAGLRSFGDGSTSLFVQIF